MRVQMFAHYYVIERGDVNRSYFLMFVDADRESWTRRISSAQRYSSSEQAEAGIERIKARRKDVKK